MCILHGSWGNWDDGPTCTIGNLTTPNFGETSKIWYDTFHQNGGSTTQNVFLCLNDPVTKQPIKAVMSIGHGVLDGICGDLALIKFKDRYLINYQTGPRAWSLELSQPGIGYLDPEGQAGGTCDVPDVMKLEWNDIYNNGKLPVCP